MFLNLFDVLFTASFHILECIRCNYGTILVCQIDGGDIFDHLASLTGAAVDSVRATLRTFLQDVWVNLTDNFPVVVILVNLFLL